MYIKDVLMQQFKPSASWDPDKLPIWLFQAAFFTAGAIIVTGGVVQRTKSRFENSDGGAGHFCALVRGCGSPGSALGMHDGTTGALPAQVAINTTLHAATDGITASLMP